MDALMIRRYLGDGTFRTIPEQDAEAVVPSAARRLQTTHDMPGGFTWVGAVDPPTEQLEALRDDLGFHDLAVEDAFSGRQQPKLQWFGDHLFIVLWRLRLTGDHRPIAISELYLFARDGLLITVERSRPGVPTLDVTSVLDAAPPPLRGNALGALTAVVSAVIEGYVAVAGFVEDELEQLEDQVFDETQEDDAARLYRLRRDVGKVGRAVATIATTFENNRDKLQDFAEQHPDPGPIRPRHGRRPRRRRPADRRPEGRSRRRDHHARELNRHPAGLRLEDDHGDRRDLGDPRRHFRYLRMNFADLPLIQLRLGWIAVVVVIIALEFWAYLTLKRRHWL